MKKSYIEKVADMIVKEAKGSANVVVVLTTYATREDYDDINRAADDMTYDDHMLAVRLIGEKIAAAGVAERVVFQPIESGEYWRWLAAAKVADNRGSRAAFANIKYHTVSGGKTRCPCCGQIIREGGWKNHASAENGRRGGRPKAVYGLLRRNPEDKTAFFRFASAAEAENWEATQTSYPVDFCRICGKEEAEEEARKLGKSLAQAVAETEFPGSVYVGE